MFSRILNMVNSWKLTILSVFFILFICIGFVVIGMNRPSKEIIIQSLPEENKSIVSEDYKCFAEMFPEEAKIMGCPKLGEIVRDETGEYRIMVEGKHFEAPLWVQFIDVAVDGKFDNNCDFTIYIEIRDGIPLAAMNTCMKAVEDVAKYCLMNDIEIKDFMHKAPKIYVELEQVI